MRGKAIMAGVIWFTLAAGAAHGQGACLHLQEVILHVMNGTGGESLTFRTRPQEGSAVWDRSGFLTADPTFTRPSDMEVELDPDGTWLRNDQGWSTESPDGQVCLGRGVYEVAVVGRMGSFEIECYGTHKVVSGDAVVTYDAGQDIFDASSLDLYDGPDDLEPTPPRNFRCTNAGRDGENPRFEWEQPEPNGVAYWYNVYRRRPSQGWRRVASGLSGREWTDEEVVINRAQGVEYLYCATDYTSRWPESDYSEEARIVGELGKRAVDSGALSEAARDPLAALCVYPNPCNPLATVRYVVPEEGAVKVALYDLAGREVAQPAEGHPGAGEYQARLDGHGLSSGVYLVRMLCGAVAPSAKVLVVK
ncbi:MAG: T9SS type A sorting domain-containing protein [candidate division KSB1 bacterium]|nr:T9SS type A sorting domain-containing protein [candidate division KSB1 bacterium]MDZ7386653.1 T9SS type A sorting domain-containing protein [candidate division KSB1 bacterium]MDZ7392560.1 T9SS type A sorting domain-containing protein [candidate division KSB1 bacterium]